MFEEEFNIETMKQEILSKEKEKHMNLKTIFKWSAVPICLVAIIGVILLYSTNNRNLKPNIYRPNIVNKDNIDMFINDISNTSNTKIDADIKVVDGVNVPYYEWMKFLGDLKTPVDFDENGLFVVYTNKDKNDDSYSYLNNYVYNCYGKENRSIKISFSKENKPIRDYYFEEIEGKTSKINNVDLKVLKYNKSYFTEFTYKEINFDIETSNITEEEFIDLLLSIIK